MTANTAATRLSGKKVGQASERWPADAVERRPVASLVPYARNAGRTATNRSAQIAPSIREWGWTMPVLIDEQSNIIAGHCRVLAAQRLGLAEVPVMVARGWTEAQRQAYAIADNKLALNAGWDEACCDSSSANCETSASTLGLTGFGKLELDFTVRPGQVGHTDPDAVPDVPAEPVSRPGDIWLLGAHRLACGD